MTPRDRYLRRTYGLTEQEHKAASEKQYNCCALCVRHLSELNQKHLTVDHSHATRKLRSLVCTYCNRYRIGRLDLYWAKELVSYFQEPTWTDRYLPKRKRKAKGART